MQRSVCTEIARKALSFTNDTRGALRYALRCPAPEWVRDLFWKDEIGHLRGPLGKAMAQDAVLLIAHDTDTRNALVRAYTHPDLKLATHMSELWQDADQLLAQGVQVSSMDALVTMAAGRMAGRVHDRVETVLAAELARRNEADVEIEF